MPQGLPDLRWFFFQERDEPRSVEQAIVQNLQAQWMVLCLLQAGKCNKQLQEWRALGLYIVQFQRIYRSLSPLLHRQLLPLLQCLDEGCAEWRELADPAQIADSLKSASHDAEQWCNTYQAVIEQELTEMLSRTS